MRRAACFLLAFTFSTGSALAVAAQAPPPPPPRPPVLPGMPGMPQRDDAAPKTGTAVLRGTVVSAETGMPLRRAQVRATGSDARDARAVSTDEKGVWELSELPAGRYAIQVSKGGYVQLSYGQGRPFEQGRPVDLADGQVLAKLDVTLPKGSVIAGRLYDEFGEAVAGARVSAMRNRFVGGTRRLVPFGGTGASDMTDDLGQFRLHGLTPGDYYVSASLGQSFGLDRSEDRTGYAPTFYPGTPALAEAQKVSVMQAQESLGITFALVPTRVANVSGVVTSSGGKPLANGMVMLVTPGMAGMSPLSSTTVTKPDGTFALTNVAPGEYRLQTQLMDLEAIGRTGSTVGMAPTETASMPLTVTGENITGLAVVTGPTATATGKVTFAGGAPPAGLLPGAVMVMGAPTDPGTFSMGGMARLKDDWTFEAAGMSDRRIFRAQVTSPGWHLKSVTVNGADVTDTGIEFAPGETASGIEIELTREMASVTGAVQGSKGEPITDFIVVSFASDASKWGYMTRFVRTARPDQSGKFVINGLPAGSYLMAALEYLEPGEEQDPEVLERLRAAGTPVTLNDGEKKDLTLTLRVAQW